MQAKTIDIDSNCPYIFHRDSECDHRMWDTGTYFSFRKPNESGQYRLYFGLKESPYEWAFCIQNKDAVTAIPLVESNREELDQAISKILESKVDGHVLGVVLSCDDKVFCGVVASLSPIQLVDAKEANKL